MLAHGQVESGSAAATPPPPPPPPPRPRPQATASVAAAASAAVPAIVGTPSAYDFTSFLTAPHSAGVAATSASASTTPKPGDGSFYHASIVGGGPNGGVSRELTAADVTGDAGPEGELDDAGCDADGVGGCDGAAFEESSAYSSGLSDSSDELSTDTLFGEADDGGGQEENEEEEEEGESPGSDDDLEEIWGDGDDDDGSGSGDGSVGHGSFGGGPVINAGPAAAERSAARSGSTSRHSRDSSGREWAGFGNLGDASLPELLASGLHDSTTCGGPSGESLPGGSPLFGGSPGGGGVPGSWGGGGGVPGSWCGAGPSSVSTTPLQGTSPAALPSLFGVGALGPTLGSGGIGSGRAAAVDAGTGSAAPHHALEGMPSLGSALPNSADAAAGA
eukprot:364161-Chlamydomonas_euryale.AAC.8